MSRVTLDWLPEIEIASALRRISITVLAQNIRHGLGDIFILATQKLTRPSGRW